LSLSFLQAQPLTKPCNKLPWKIVLEKNRIMKKTIFAILIGIISIATFAQNDFLYNFQNPTLHNPASVGSDSAINVFSVYKNKIDNDNCYYHSEILGFTAPIPKLHGGVGFIASRVWYPSNNASNTSLTGIYSYHKKAKNNFSYSIALMPGLKITDYGNYPIATEYQFDISLSTSLQWKKLTLGVSNYDLINLNSQPIGFKLFFAYNQNLPKNSFDNKIHFSPMFSIVTASGDLHYVTSGTLRYKFFQAGADVCFINCFKTWPQAFFHAGVNVGNLSISYRYSPNWYRSTVNEVSLSYRFGKK